MQIYFASFITARVRSTREGTVFTGVCLSTFRGGGTYLPDGGGGGTYSGLDGGRVPTYGRGGGGTYSALAGGGVPTQLWLGGYLPWLGGGTYLGQGGEVPTQLWLGGGYLPWPGVGGYLPRYPPA